MKVKSFIKNIIKFLESPFTTKSKEELDKTTEEINETIQKPVNQHTMLENNRYSGIDTHEQSHLSSVSMELKKEENMNISAAPPPPPPIPTNVNTVIQNSGRDALFAAIREGKELKRTETKKPESAINIGDPFVNELQQRLKSRRKDINGVEERVTSAGQYAEDAKLFEQARKEEAERQARSEESQNKKVAAAEAMEKANKEASMAAEAAELSAKPKPISLKPGEIPLPPPPPPPAFQANNVNKPHSTPIKQTVENKGFKMDQNELNNIRLKSVGLRENNFSKKEESPPIDYRSILKNKNQRGPGRG